MFRLSVCVNYYIVWLSSSMAALQRLEEHLNCSICLDTYSIPKLLQCFHVFCQHCLEKVVTKDQQGQLSVTCPTCRQVTSVSARGVKELQSAFHINQLLDILNENKRVAADDVQINEAAVGSPSDFTNSESTNSCSDHNGKAIELYCTTCQELICCRCAIKGSKHHSHDYEDLKSHKAEIMSSFEPIEIQLTIISQALAQLEKRFKETSKQQTSIKADIHSAFGQLQQALDARKEELIAQLQKNTDTKLKTLKIQKDQLVMARAQLSSCLLFMEENLQRSSSWEDVVIMKEKIFPQMKELSTKSIAFQPDMLKPNTEANMIFIAPANFVAECGNYGQVSTLNSPDPSKCYAAGKGVETAVVGQSSIVTLRTIDFSSQPCKEEMLLEFELVSEITGAVAKGSVERKGHSQYTVSYQPTIKGKHLLSIMVNSQHIRRSPFNVSAKLPVKEIGNLILSIKKVNEPVAVALTQRGEVVITEGTGHCVSVFRPNGEKIRSFGTHGSGKGQFKFPSGVTVDSKGNILVADRANHRIQIFTTEGDFLTEVGTEGSGPLQFYYPEGITFNANKTKLYVVDGNEHIQILNPDLSYSATFGRKGRGSNKFDYPRHVACDSSGNVYVTDFKNYRIQVFTDKGSFLRLLGESELNRPCGIAIDSNDRIYVSNGDQVTVFSYEGQLVTSFGKSGERPGAFRGPAGLAVDHSGVVYVCDYYNKRVQLF